MAIPIPSTDDVGAFFRVGARKPDRRLTAGVFSFRLRPHPARHLGKPHRRRESTSHYRRSIQKNAGLFLSDGHERMQAMTRQRDELVPAGEASGSLDGPVKAIRDTSPQAQRGFTQADQVNQLVSAREADPDRGFMARLMALCCLPRTNPGNQHQYKRVNGPFTLYMNATSDNKLPFGNLPRLLLAWVCTEAVRTQSRELILGASLSEFMRTLGVLSSDSGGTSWRAHSSPQPDERRLFRCSISLHYEDEQK